MEGSVDVAFGATPDPVRRDLTVAAAAVRADASPNGLVAEHDRHIHVPAAAVLDDEGVHCDRSVPGPRRPTRAPGWSVSFRLIAVAVGPLIGG